MASSPPTGDVVTDPDFILSRGDSAKQTMKVAFTGAAQRRCSLPKYRAARWIEQGVFPDEAEARRWYLKARMYWYGALADAADCNVRKPPEAGLTGLSSRLRWTSGVDVDPCAEHCNFGGDEFGRYVGSS